MTNVRDLHRRLEYITAFASLIPVVLDDNTRIYNNIRRERVCPISGG